jgi:hypothetical protein
MRGSKEMLPLGPAPQEARHLLEDLVVEGKGKEQPHIHRAIREIEKALAVK